ncbi:MAG: HlyD family efflux transporter periplasmic adaptor subunit [Methylococcaceae bacterium]|nr:HlyD family efflux transporter periplasmic adaptor subunit [Methylococcaceae bacterium]MDP2393574.1 HlyD family efflux transporter periplasmic adaptor subunit [Methylococcaceae bacterium]MDP3019681.1 HlyD family efflux transporter periplasmic adaptor subunit [Methylococcaceae bacterium]MDP3389959.1 HlyD family efflux transporter periplasmic adaptor subunit [Methylococcaceae bacterium]MDP3933624.1 HlyD family efflux transporter periplasmic adaptor subunit [Methylococcaceae bacterium]
MSKNTKRLLILAALIIVAAAITWWALRPAGLPAAIVSGNGRIEATEIDIATKMPGRVAEILAREGDFVASGQVLARMDTFVLLAQQAEAQAQVHQAESAWQTAKSVVVQRESEQNAATAVVAQRRAEFDAASKRLQRSQRLVGEGATPQQEVDDDRARVLGMQAAIRAAEAQVAAAGAGIEAAKSQVLQSKSLIEAVKATVTRLQADIDDSVLKAPRDGRVQYRVAEPGEVLDSGGRVLNMVDLSDVYMTFFLPTEAAGKIALGSDIHLVLDAMPNYVIPAKASFVASVAQFTPKTVETESERLKLMFRVRARLDPELLKQHLTQVKTGVPGKAYVKLDPAIEWPAELAVKLPK